MRGAAIFPYPLKGQRAGEYAASVGAQLASGNRGAGFSLSSASLRSIDPGCRLVLPSPNGAALACAADHLNVLAGCLRNAAAVATAAQETGPAVTVIRAGIDR